MWNWWSGKTGPVPGGTDLEEQKGGGGIDKGAHCNVSAVDHNSEQPQNITVSVTSRTGS